ncbi:MAG: hypothetical protein NTW19_15875 [Planctomycetota bacterium]|nr:hypothetical protein [Planctomycetota bacterium]
MSKSEAQAAQALRVLLDGVASGSTLTESAPLREVLSSLEYFLPEILSEVYPYWKSESLDGFFLSKAVKTDHLRVEFRGVCILISDQAIAPFHLQMRASPTADEIEWLNCRLGSRGSGAGDMERIVGWSGRVDVFLQASLQPIDWVYHAAFGEA